MKNLTHQSTGFPYSSLHCSCPDVRQSVDMKNNITPYIFEQTLNSSEVYLPRRLWWSTVINAFTCALYIPASYLFTYNKLQ